MSGILVDTCIWSLALRGNSPCERTIAETLSQLIDENQVRMIGPIRQELLSGYTDKNSFDRLRQKLKYFPNQPIIDSDYEAAAEYSSLCRTKGIQGSHTDFLICAVSIRARYRIFTSDKDFLSYSKHLSLSLFGSNQEVCQGNC